MPIESPLYAPWLEELGLDVTELLQVLFENVLETEYVVLGIPKLLIKREEGKDWKSGWDYAIGTVFKVPLLFEDGKGQEHQKEGDQGPWKEAQEDFVFLYPHVIWYSLSGIELLGNPACLSNDSVEFGFIKIVT